VGVIKINQRGKYLKEILQRQIGVSQYVKGKGILGHKKEITYGKLIYITSSYNKDK
jgi:hypothetical protein